MKTIELAPAGASRSPSTRAALAALALLFLEPAGHCGEQWQYETHNGVVYGHSDAGRSSIETEHNGIVYGEDSDGHRWTSETHNGVTYVHPR